MIRMTAQDKMIEVPTGSAAAPQLINIVFVWNRDPRRPREILEATAAIGEWDGVSNDDEIFYWFEPGEAIVGDHGEFTVLEWEAA